MGLIVETQIKSISLFSLFSFLLFCPPLANGEFSPTYFDLEVAKKRCTPKHSESEELLLNEFEHGQYTFPKMSDHFEKVYASGKRIGLHVNYDPERDQFFLYYAGQYRSEEPQPVPITPNFIASITRHIEMAHEMGFASFVFFSDMGHSHFFFTEDQWRELEEVQNNFPKLYKRIFANSETRILYHLSEKLDFFDGSGSYIQKTDLVIKYWNRNFFTKNDPSDFYEIQVQQKAGYHNTVSSINGYNQGYGFSISASRNGCFPYRDRNGNLRYFDISIYELRREHGAEAIDPI